MAQNRHEFTAGVDTYNGTTAYTSLSNFRACGGTELLKLDLRVSHVGGGDLKIYGLWKDATFMVHGEPLSMDVVVGDFRVGT